MTRKVKLRLPPKRDHVTCLF